MVYQVVFLFLSGRECKVLWPGLAFGVGDPHGLHDNELTQTLLQCILAEFDLRLHHSCILPRQRKKLLLHALQALATECSIAK